ncbi:MAG: glycoside hydrolase family 3 N-terminal domain-containing protein [Erysipelotrichaceae bacterium]|nr:glycoside hydrolase family 3 N-terminal domain-containing protein [Erysipelotrichaceae bacterium]
MLKKIILLLITLILFSACNHKEEIYIPVNQEEEEIKEEIVLTKEEEILNSMTLEEKIGQLFIVRYENIDEEDEVKQYQLGGITFYGKDFRYEDKDSIIELINSLQSDVKIPMFMSVDEEGGSVARVSRWYQYRSEIFLSPRDYYEQGGLDLVLQMEEEKAQLLSSLGLNMNLSPVADISDKPGAFMYDRSLGEDACTTAEFVCRTAKISADYGVGSVIKHFPGHGDNTDTHFYTTRDTRSLEELKENDLIPFQAAMDDGYSAVMIGHTVVEALDDEYPSSLSKKVHDYIRKQMSFDGVIMPDALDMDTVSSSFNGENVAVLAIMAGNDILCTSEYKEQYEAVLQAVKDNKISIEQIDESVLRILRWKLQLGIIS